MKRSICFILVASALSGCATSTPVVIDDGVRTRTFMPCTSDALCFREGYNVVWDNWCPGTRRDFPVSYRLKQFEYESNRVEYILLPRAELVRDGGEL